MHQSLHSPVLVNYSIVFFKFKQNWSNKKKKNCAQVPSTNGRKSTLWPVQTETCVRKVQMCFPSPKRDLRHQIATTQSLPEKHDSHVIEKSRVACDENDQQQVQGKLQIAYKWRSPQSILDPLAQLKMCSGKNRRPQAPHSVKSEIFKLLKHCTYNSQ